MLKRIQPIISAYSYESRSRAAITEQATVFGAVTTKSNRYHRLGYKMIECGAHAADHAAPIARSILPEQLRGRILGVVRAIEQPPPVRHERQQYPNRLCQGA